MSKARVLLEKLSIPKLGNFEDVKQWIASLNMKARTPRGLKKEYELVQYIYRIIDTAEKYKNSLIVDEHKNSIMEIVSRFSADTISKLTQALSYNEDKPTVVKGRYATYAKEDTSAYSKFESAITDIESFLSTLKGYHAEPLNNLSVVFVSKKNYPNKKGKAWYGTTEDALFIRLDAMGKTTEEYGSLRYVILHELGHRYLRWNKQKWNYDAVEWITTEYSKTDSWSGEEKFAELFAISNWASKYSEYSEKINKFKTMLTGKVSSTMPKHLQDLIAKLK